MLSSLHAAAKAPTSASRSSSSGAGAKPSYSTSTVQALIGTTLVCRRQVNYTPVLVFDKYMLTLRQRRVTSTLPAGCRGPGLPGNHEPVSRVRVRVWLGERRVAGEIAG